MFENGERENSNRILDDVFLVIFIHCVQHIRFSFVFVAIPLGSGHYLDRAQCCYDS